MVFLAIVAVTDWRAEELLCQPVKLFAGLFTLRRSDCEQQIQRPAFNVHI
jgi:hypothetical protein